MMYVLFVKNEYPAHLKKMAVIQNRDIEDIYSTWYLYLTISAKVT